MIPLARWKIDSPGDEETAEMGEEKVRDERTGRFDEVCDDVSIKVQLRTLNNIVGVCKGQYSQGVYVLIFPFDFAGLCTGVHLNPVLYRRPNREKTRHKKRHVDRDIKREKSSPHWLSYVRHYSPVLLH